MKLLNKSSQPQAKCSWCELDKYKLIGTPNTEGAVICEKCIYIAKTIGTQTLPVGSPICWKCDTYPTGIKVLYVGGVIAIYRVFMGTLLYLQDSVKGDWTRGMRPTKAYCTTCNSAIPLFSIDENTSLLHYHTLDNTHDTNGKTTP